MKAFLLKPVLWWAIAGSCAAVGGTVYVVHKTTTEVRVPLVGDTTVLSDSTSASTPDSSSPTTRDLTGPLETSGSLATSTILGSPFTPKPTPIVSPSTAPATTSPSTVAPCPPCPQYAYTVLAATTVTNTGPTTIPGGVGLWPGTAVTGFPPGSAVVDAASTQALGAQTELTAAYLSAASRIPTVIDAQLGGQVLTPGTYTALTPLDLTGTLTLDGPGRYVFQTASTLITASGSRVQLVNGARACDVAWQVGSSATLGTNSTFVGTIMALTSITVTTGVQVHGRALARNGAVTLDSDVFTALAC